MIRGFGWFGNREGFGAVSGSEILDSLYRSVSEPASPQAECRSVVSCVENSVSSIRNDRNGCAEDGNSICK